MRIMKLIQMSFTDLPAKFQVKRINIHEIMPNFDEAFLYHSLFFVHFNTKHINKKFFLESKHTKRE